jgi:hypothetical protein
LIGILPQVKISLCGGTISMLKLYCLQKSLDNSFDHLKNQSEDQNLEQFSQKKYENLPELRKTAIILT